MAQDFLDSLVAQTRASVRPSLEGALSHLPPGSGGAWALAQHADSLLGTGKLFRARLVGVGWLLAGNLEISPALVQAATALELFQASALTHDDIIDNSQLRRGKPAAHRSLAQAANPALPAEHRDRYGAHAAIVLGDLLLSAAGAVFNAGCEGAPQGNIARTYFDRMCTEVAYGQFLDLTEETRGWDLSPQEVIDRALGVVEHKTAGYSVVYPLAIGAALGGMSQENLRALTGPARKLGVAFQLQDDVLGVYGLAEATGKPTGGDLVEGKRTALLGLTLKMCAVPERERLMANIGREDLSGAEIEWIQGLIESCGARAAHREMIDTLRDEFLTAISGIKAPPSALEALKNMAYAMTEHNA